jgi:hypothetical protein
MLMLVVTASAVLAAIKRLKPSLRYAPVILLCALAMVAGCSPAAAPVLPPLLAPATVAAPASVPHAQRGAASPEAAYRAYFAALRNSDHVGAAAWLSDYSLGAQATTRAAVADRLKMGVYGALRYLDLQVLDVSLVETISGAAPTAIIHSRVTLQQGVTAPRVQEQWDAARYEHGDWLINAGGLIDAGRADAPAQAQNGVTVRLAGMQRYTTHTRLILEVKNDNDRAVWWGTGSEPALILHSGAEAIRVPGRAYRFDAGQRYSNIMIDIDQRLPAYPGRMELAGWSLAGEGQPPTWSYTVDVPDWQAL